MKKRILIISILIALALTGCSKGKVKAGETETNDDKIETNNGETETNGDKIETNDGETETNDDKIETNDTFRIHFAYKNDYGANDDDYLYYSNDYFKNPSTEYNSHLATLSIYMAKYSMNPGAPKSLDDEGWYLTQSDRVCNFYKAIGFNNSQINEDYKKRTAFDTIGIAAANRKVGDYTVIASTIRSGGYFNEWENNVFLGDGSKSDMMHEGWYNAANKVINFLDDYMSTNSIKGKIKIWISGFSRGGATMNLTAGLLDNRIKNNGSDKVFEKANVVLENSDLYAYTFEAPQGANINSKTVVFPKDDLYNNIFNIINPNDVVTKLAMSSFGFTRFGIDKFITTQFHDPTNFKNNRKTARALYGNNNDWDCDDLQMYTIPGGVLSLITDLFNVRKLIVDLADALIKINEYGELPDWIKKDSTKVHYDANIITTLLIDRACEAMKDRNYYCNNIQDFARGLLKMMMCDVNDPNAPSWISFASNFLFQLIACYALGDVHTFIDLPGMTGITSDQAKSILLTSFEVYNSYPNEFISLIINMSEIFDNHLPEINVSHLQAQDSYYVDEFNYGKSDKDKVTLVPLRESAGFARIKMREFNQCILYGPNNNYKDEKIKIVGHNLVDSDIEYVEEGYAAGFYDHGGWEYIELFFPEYCSHQLNYAEYSLKPDHDLWALYSYYPTNNKRNKDYYKSEHKFKDLKDIAGDEGPFEYFIFQPNYPKVLNLTNTTWKIVCLRTTLPEKQIDYQSNGNNFTNISVTFEMEGIRLFIKLFYDDTLAAIDAMNPFYRLNWSDENYATFTITGGNDVADYELIDWLYLNATLINE